MRGTRSATADSGVISYEQKLRHCFYTPGALSLRMLFNFLMFALNIYMVYCDITLSLSPKPASPPTPKSSTFGKPAAAPSTAAQQQLQTSYWLLYGDVFVTGVLLVECLERLFMHRWDFKQLWKTNENRFDVVLLLVSVLVLLVFPFEMGTKTGESAEAFMLVLRVVRDAVRVVRTFYFLKELRNNIVDFQYLRSHRSGPHSADLEAALLGGHPKPQPDSPGLANPSHDGDPSLGAYRSMGHTQVRSSSGAPAASSTSGGASRSTTAPAPSGRATFAPYDGPQRQTTSTAQGPRPGASPFGAQSAAVASAPAAPAKAAPSVGLASSQPAPQQQQQQELSQSATSPSARSPTTGPPVARIVLPQIKKDAGTAQQQGATPTNQQTSSRPQSPQHAPAVHEEGAHSQKWVPKHSSSAEHPPAPAAPAAPQQQAAEEPRPRTPSASLQQAAVVSEPQKGAESLEVGEEEQEGGAEQVGEAVGAAAKQGGKKKRHRKKK